MPVSLVRQAIRRMLAVACCLSAALVLAPTGAARLTPIIPPGNGAGNQYLETLPGPGGSQPLHPNGGPTSGPSGSASTGVQTSPAGTTAATGQQLASTPAGNQTLARHGEVGRVVRDLAPQSRPTLALSTPGAGAESPANSIGKLIVGRGHSGLGVALPLILGAAAVAAIAFALRRRFG
jgi:hypothetical protein